MKVVYVVGPYRAATQEEVSRNIERAREAGQALQRAGLCAVVPHLNFGSCEGLTDQDVLDACLELVGRCDALLLLLPGWEASSGSHLEFMKADRLRKPTFLSVEAVKLWRDAEVVRRMEAM